MNIRIMIVDDQALMRDGLSSILQLKEEMILSALMMLVFPDAFGP